MRRLFAVAFALCLAAPAISQQAFAQATAPSAPSAQPSPAAPADRNFVVFFQEWSASFDSAAQGVINASARAALLAPSEPVIVAGYADPTGTARANALVSALRSELVADALVAAGVPAARIHKEAQGSTIYTFNPQESRRVVIIIGAQ